MQEESGQEAVIQYEGVEVGQTDGSVLKDVTFQIFPGEFYYLIGRTGSGKSSLLKSFYAELPIVAGKATICGFQLNELKRSQLPYLRRKMGIIFQDFQLLNDRNAKQNLEFVLRATGWENQKEIENRLSEVLNEVGLLSQASKMPYQLSGGEQQRLVIARALLNNPILILADEPTGNLDPETSDEIMKLLIRINREHNTAVVMATHNYQLMDKYPSKILQCEQGELKVGKGIYLRS
jgi:cell division transport system ATP-binding protein